MADINLTAAEAESSFRRALEAFNTGDWETWRDRIASQCRYEEIATDEAFEGADAYLERAQAWRAAFPDMRGTVNALVATGTTVVAEITWQGTHTGTLQTAMGPVASTGRTIQTRAAMIVESDDSGRTVRVRHYTNPLLLMTQLGLLPAPVATTAGS